MKAIKNTSNVELLTLRPVCSMAFPNLLRHMWILIASLRVSEKTACERRKQTSAFKLKKDLVHQQVGMKVATVSRVGIPKLCANVLPENCKCTARNNSRFQRAHSSLWQRRVLVYIYKYFIALDCWLLSGIFCYIAALGVISSRIHAWCRQTVELPKLQSWLPITYLHYFSLWACLLPRPVIHSVRQWVPLRKSN